MQTQKTGSRQAAPQQMLYIQMEFCPRTLRQVLDESPSGMEPEDCWQVGNSYQHIQLFVLRGHACWRDQHHDKIVIEELRSENLHHSVQVVRQLLAGLANIHSQGIIHRVSVTIQRPCVLLHFKAYLCVETPYCIRSALCYVIRNFCL